MEKKYLAIGFFIILIGIILFFILKKSKTNSNTIQTLLWSGNCNNTPTSICDLNNNCAIYCEENNLNSVKSVIPGKCSSTQKAQISGKNWNIFCNKEAIITPPELNCESGFQTTYKGILPENNIPVNMESTSIDGKCPQYKITSPPNLNIDPSRLICNQAEALKYNKDFVVCCQSCTSPPSPTCNNGETQVFNKTCSFISSQCNNGQCSVNCDGISYPVQKNCENIETKCINGNCVGCCVKSINPPSCQNGQSQVWSGSCNSINSSCNNGSCSVICDGEKLSLNSTCFKNISTSCNNAGCVVCCN